MDWNDGYVVDTEYLTGFAPKLAPSYLNTVCVINGYEPVPIDRPFTYFELGCGQGFTANMLAASNPQGRFYAADFNPAHVANARELSSTARLDNLTLLENSFAELAQGRVEVPELDFIVMHGIYSWVTPENRRHLVNFIGRHLKPGGIAYLTYNALPGWSTAAPLQRLALEYASAHPNTRDVQVEETRAFINRMIDTKAGYFAANTGVILKNRLENWRTAKPCYLAHEYMNECWQALYHADVARDLRQAKLEFAGSVILGLAFPEMMLTKEQLALLDTIPGVTGRETVKDFMMNTAFRADVFVRGARRMSALRRAQWLPQVGMALTVPREFATLGFTPETMSAKDDMAAPLLNHLANGPRSLAELASLPGQTVESIFHVLALLTTHDQGTPFFLSSAKASMEPAHRMNLAVAEQATLDDRYQALASPLLGTALPAGQIQRLVYLLLRRSPDRRDAATMAQEVWNILSNQESPVVVSGKPLNSKEEEMAEVLSTVKKVLEQRLPLWRQLKML
jgi:SAM-dependent methyltransferase